jgi:hypothetical protein
MTAPSLLRLRHWAKPRRRLRADMAQLVFAAVAVAAALLLTRAGDWLARTP